jgi:hypothetical protein
MERKEECPRLGQVPLKKELDIFCTLKGIKSPPNFHDSEDYKVAKGQRGNLGT